MLICVRTSDYFSSSSRMSFNQKHAHPSLIAFSCVFSVTGPIHVPCNRSWGQRRSTLARVVTGTNAPFVARRRKFRQILAVNHALRTTLSVNVGIINNVTFDTSHRLSLETALPSAQVWTWCLFCSLGTWAIVVSVNPFLWLMQFSLLISFKSASYVVNLIMFETSKR